MSLLLRSAAAGRSFLCEEWKLLLLLATGGLFYAYGPAWLVRLDQPAWFGFLLCWLFSIILMAAFAVVHHAEALAEILGEPFGTLILTLAVTGIEVLMISAVMAAGSGRPALARDAMFAVIMIVLNGMIGLCLILGGLRYHEQSYNLQGANAFLSVITPLSVLGLILPTITVTTPGPTFSPLQATFFMVMSLGLYGVFLAIQNIRHPDYFVHESRADGPKGRAEANHATMHALGYHAVLLLAHLLPLVLLSKKLAVPINHAIEVLNAPPALGGLLVAVLILAPESMSAIRAALANQLQRSVNILLGSALATISLTIPSVLLIGFLTGQTIVLGLEPVEMLLLVLTLGVSILTFAGPRTNVLQGAVHLLLFLAFLMLLFEN